MEDRGKKRNVREGFGRVELGKEGYRKKEFGREDGGKEGDGRKEYRRQEYGRQDKAKEREGKKNGMTEGKYKEEKNGIAEGKYKGEKNGIAEGKYKGEKNGMAEGKYKGEKNGMAEGKREGKKNGMTEGKREGKKNGMAEGKCKGEKSSRKKEMAGKRKAEENKRSAEQDRMKKGKAGKEICPVFSKCGGCQMLDMPYEKQLEKKQKEVETLLKDFCKVHKIIGMEEPYHYRNKVHAAFGYRKGETISGVYKEGTHEIVPVELCRIEDKKADEIIGTIRGMLKSFKIRTYDEDTGYGLLRHVMVRRGFATGQVMVVLVTVSPVFPSRNNFVKALREKHPEITTIIQNLNDRNTSMVLGDKEKVLYGKGYIEDVLCGCTFRISSRSFYQVNPVQTEKLYTKAIEAAGLTGKETVIDAYCGIGTIGIVASKKAKQVIGVELNEDAVRDAVENAKRNEVKNIQFYNNDAGRFMVNMAADGERVDVVLMDPPRSGSTEEFIDSVAVMAPERVVYVSCNPETLARDLKMFGEKGYRAVEAWPVDLFPWTGHVETVCLLSKLHSDHHIEVELEMDELDLTAAESKATYEEIKDYVLKQSGLKVSNLYIAQVKQKCGIIERANYNLPKSENSRQPKCPPEKEAAIREALEHFQMI